MPKQTIEQIIYDFREGRLTEQNLRETLREPTSVSQTRQDLLYLQAIKTSITSSVIGMRIVENGEISDGPEDPKEWPYQTVLEAVRDGWRIIKFPELALLLDEKKTYGLGCEFILEKWS